MKGLAPNESSSIGATVSSAHAWAVARAGRRPDAVLAAEVLLAYVMKASREEMLAYPERRLGAWEWDRFQEMATCLEAGAPLAYLVGEREFYSLPFEVDPTVLIPRPETEMLVDVAIQEVSRGKSARAAICDVGTGSGCIAIALKRRISSAFVTGVDISLPALNLARRNGRRLQADVSWVRSDLLDGFQGPFDLVVANLPYIPTTAVDDLPPEIRNYEPRLALDGGNDGLVLIDRLLRMVHGRLRNGLVCLEVGIGQADVVARHMRDDGFHVKAIHSDFAGIPRVVVGEYGQGKSHVA